METVKKDIHIYISALACKAFGDALLSAYFTHILIDNGVDAVLYLRRHVKLREYLLCPLTRSIRKVRKWGETGERPRLFIQYHYGEVDTPSVPIIEQYIMTFTRKYHIPLERNLNYIPVAYHNIPEIRSVDVSLCTSSGDVSPYRNWPYFEQLKKKLDDNGITYIDLTKEEIKFIECLNYVKKSKLYVGLEAGVSHYVSQVANGKALILQSGFEDFKFWCSYDYEHLSVPVSCRICRCHIGTKTQKLCKYNHKCMRDMSVDMVFNKIIEKI